MPKIEIEAARQGSGTRYPPPHDAPCKARRWRILGEAAGLTQFGVNLVRLPPGTWSSQRHWHALEDEFVYVLEGELVLVTDEGEETMVRGDCAGFKAGVRDGHCFQNRSSKEATLLVVGSRVDGDHGEYPDIDMVFLPDRYGQGRLRAQGRHALLKAGQGGGHDQFTGQPSRGMKVALLPMMQSGTQTLSHEKGGMTDTETWQACGVCPGRWSVGTQR